MSTQQKKQIIASFKKLVCEKNQQYKKYISAVSTVVK